MEIKIQGSPKEIAALVYELQERQECDDIEVTDPTPVPDWLQKAYSENTP